MAVDRLKFYSGNARTHSKSQIRQIARSIERFGFINPVLISDDDEIIAGHGRVEAAKLLGHSTVPVLRLTHLGPAERRAYVLADNKLALNAGWDRQILAKELQGLVDLGFDVEITGFGLAEVDIIIDSVLESAPGPETGPEDTIRKPGEMASSITRVGDVWTMGRHRLICADAREAESFVSLMAGETADLLFTDPPYNVRINGHVSGLGRTHHEEFVMAAGEMTREAFIEFLRSTLGHAAAHSRDGAIAYVCMDWRHMGELMQAGEAVFSELKNVCVWNKTNAGMGNFYRSKHEMVFVYKVGMAPHINTFGLGDTGRYRTNVWDYAGVNTFKADRADELHIHPTVKPVALVADAIRDCSKRGGIVLDAFGGSGTTLIAAEKTGRRARLLELDPRYCDAIVARYQSVTGKAAILSDGRTFEAVAEERRSAPSIQSTPTEIELEEAA
ncbi:site-specific DNA-methyltransferase [Methylobacterium mesophilicum SR1.6/6]|uniref:site-specific DNA-methyltransferase (adenine-specific) n=2 Tax=Methylobacterium mesophilicum TaxID=39956 RepID=A0A6B9G296_9HYPH|nr:site-specific DNA-methyltransferase [Methylobacterium mesophilicum SR1.6/6]